MNALLGVAVMLARLWGRAATLGLSPGEAGRRRRELESDLWEHRNCAQGAGAPPASVARQILLRSIAGIPADLAWRADMARNGPHRRCASRAVSRSVLMVRSRAHLLSKSAVVLLCLLGVAGMVELGGNMAALKELRDFQEAARARESQASAPVTNPLDSQNQAAPLATGGLPAVEVTYDGGDTWKKYSLPTPAGSQACEARVCGRRPVLSFSRDGTLWAAFGLQGSARGVWLSRSPDGGACFADPQKVSGAPTVPLKLVTSVPGEVDVQLAASLPASGNVHAADRAGAGVSAVAAAGTPGLKAFTATVDVTGAGAPAARCAAPAASFLPGSPRSETSGGCGRPPAGSGWLSFLAIAGSLRFERRRPGPRVLRTGLAPA